MSDIQLNTISYDLNNSTDATLVYHQLCSKCTSNNINDIKYIHSTGFNIHVNITPLRLAIKYHSNTVVKYLIETANIDSYSIEDLSLLLIQAVEYNNIEILKLLLEHPKVDPTIHNIYVLQKAYLKENYKIVNILIDDLRIVKAVLNNIKFENLPVLIKQKLISKLNIDSAKELKLFMNNI